MSPQTMALSGKPFRKVGSLVVKTTKEAMTDMPAHSTAQMEASYRKLNIL